MDNSSPSSLIVDTTYDDHTKSMPEHWKVPESRPGNFLSYICVVGWHILCLTSVSKPDLEHHWQSKQTDDAWTKQTEMFVSRLSNSNTAAGLVLTTTAVFMTTNPPDTKMWDYLREGPMFLCYLALFHALVSIWFGTWLILVLQTTTTDWAIKVLMKNRFRLCWSLILMSLPTLSFLFSAFCLLNAIVVVTVCSSQLLFRIIVIIEYAGWWICAIMAVFCLLAPGFLAHPLCPLMALLGRKSGSRTAKNP